MKQHLIIALSALAVPGTSAFAQESEIQPETLTVEERISEGNHVYVMDMGISGPSQISVLNASDLSMEGNIGSGNFSQMLMTPDRSIVYTSSIYARRYTYGEIEAVVHEWDAVTLNAKREFNVSTKLAQTLSQPGVLNLSADGEYLVLQNATPATSVNIVDLQAGEDLLEIPTPGCWSAYPTVTGNAFSTLCGDGTVTKYGWTADGEAVTPVKSEKIFDAETDPLFASAVRVGGNLVYVSYSGTLVFVDDSGDAPKLVKRIDFAEEGWAPSGYSLMGYHKPTNTLFVIMHSKPFDGSHKAPAEEIWAINMETGAVVGRAEASSETNITIGNSGGAPVILGVDHRGGVHRYDVAVGEGGDVTITKAVSREGVARFPTILTTDF